MTGLDDKHERQARVAEVGCAGQLRIRDHVAVVRERGASTAEADYLRRAGVSATIILPCAAPPPFAHADAFRHAPSRALGAAAWRALEQLRRTIGR